MGRSIYFIVELTWSLNKMSYKKIYYHFGLNLQTDFLLILLRDMLTAFPDLRVILMSATVDTTLFCEYFGNCQIVEVHGRVHPVQRKMFTVVFFVVVFFNGFDYISYSFDS